MPFSRFWDISMSLSNGIWVWPGDTEFVRKVRTNKKGDQSWSNSEICMGCHTGTHMDAPRHVFQQGGDVNSIPLAMLIGECRVVEIISDTIGAQDISSIAPSSGERILFKTANTRLFSDGKFHEQYVHFEEDAAKTLVESQVVLVGTDGPSVDPYAKKFNPAHTAFCEAGIVVLENLVLHEVEPGKYTLICLPMKLEGSDGAPVRAILAR